MMRTKEHIFNIDQYQGFARINSFTLNFAYSDSRPRVLKLSHLNSSKEYKLIVSYIKLLFPIARVRVQ